MTRSSAAKRAFTLLELMVSTTIALLVVSAATSAIFVITRSLNQSGQSSAADSEAQLVAEYLVSQLQSVGGGAVRPWMAVVIDNNTGGNNSDVLTFADVPVELPGSITISQFLEVGSFSFFVQTDVDGFGAPLGRCPLAELRKDTNGDGFPERQDVTAAAYSIEELRNQQVILTNPDGTTWRSVVVTNLGFGTSREGCFAQFELSGGTSMLANGALARADRFSGNFGPESPDEWVLGQMSFVRVREWRFAPPTPGNEGRILERLTGNTGFSADRVLFEGVLDLQVSPGYDQNPFDGIVAETADGLNDEWLNSAPGDTPFVDLPRGLGVISPDTLRMLDIAVVVALPRAERKVTVNAFDGAPRLGFEARVAGGRAYLRNQLLFL
ncbi:MAG: prepilin-type N-terminal cleavage/methylation domain-containing protein [Deltaproteobacteria bacterium]|nr:prepilin-type N-terminal cleavage/methylation domain-containing protein [Deltaproteobacteria bacterium]